MSRSSWFSFVIVKKADVFKEIVVYLVSVGRD